MATFALVDGNSFYASCQIAFEPGLKDRPVVVLSNNDGCVVAANSVAKSLNTELKNKAINLGQGGYKSSKPQSIMFQPFFKVKWIMEKHNAAVFSSNYELYADMSNRMHSITKDFAFRQEIYSIDESFLDLTGLEHLDLTNYGHQIKEKVLKHIGIPVAVGIGSTKTLAKLANHLAKKHSGFDGVLDLKKMHHDMVDTLLSRVSIGNIWGIGRRLSARLNSDGITSAKELKYANKKRIRKAYGVVVEKTLLELNGVSCIALEDAVNDKKQIITSRSFGRPVATYLDVESAVVNYVTRASEKLRKQKGVCLYITVFINTDRFKDSYYANSETISLIYPSDNLFLLAKLAKKALKRIWVHGLEYQKAGVVLSEIKKKGPIQTDIFAQNPKYSPNEKQDRLMSVMDEINRKEGRGTLFLAASNIPEKSAWEMKRNLMSPRYTTRWDEMLVVS
jgi:DNA polymerase V